MKEGRKGRKRGGKEERGLQKGTEQKEILYRWKDNISIVRRERSLI